MGLLGGVVVVVQTFLDEAFGLGERMAGFSDDVEDVVEPARQLLWEPGVGEDEYSEAREALERALEWPMSPRQRVQAQYVLAMTLERLGGYEAALEAGERARELAAGLHERRALARVLEVRARWLSVLARVREAAEAYEECLATLEALERDGQPGAERDRLGVVAQLAGYTFFLGNIARTEALVQEGRRLLSRAQGAALEAAALELAQAQIHHWRSQPEQAIRAGAEAAEAFARLGAAESEATARLTVAEAAIQRAEAMPRERVVRDDHWLLELARDHVQRAMDCSELAGDERGVAMARLVMERWRRVCGLSGDHVGVCREVVMTARRQRDAVLETLALKALGDELAAVGCHEPRATGDQRAARGEMEEALGSLPASAVECWQAALALAQATGLPALEVWPRRALRLHEELDARVHSGPLGA